MAQMDKRWGFRGSDNCHQSHEKLMQDTKTCQYWWRTYLDDSSSILDVTMSGIKGQNGLTMILKPHNIPIIGSKCTASQQAADSKQFGKAVQAIIRLL